MEFLITAQHTGDEMLTVADKTNYRNLLFSRTINLITSSSGGSEISSNMQVAFPWETRGEFIFMTFLLPQTLAPSQNLMFVCHDYFSFNQLLSKCNVMFSTQILSIDKYVYFHYSTLCFIKTMYDIMK